MENRVSITRTDSYSPDKVEQAVWRHFELLGLAEHIRPGMKVLIKPNLLMKRRPEEGTTTHPAFVRAIILCLQRLGVSDITIADSPGGPFTGAMLSPIYESTGMKAVAEETGAKLNWDFGSFEKKAEHARMVSGFTLISAVKDADFIIDAPKLKTHGMTMLSGAVKNLFGTVPGLMKPEFHWRFPEKDRFCHMLLDLCETVRPDVVFVDGIVSMEGNGPSGGTLRETGLILASRSPYAADLALCRILGIRPDVAPTVSLAIERRLCPESAEKIDFCGDPVPALTDYKLPQSKSVYLSAYIPKPFRPLADKLLTSRPVIRKRRCVGCGKCAESCPAQTIHVVSRKAEIDYSKCIRCYCCHEMCQVKAIDIKRFRIFNL